MRGFAGGYDCTCGGSGRTDARTTVVPTRMPSGVGGAEPQDFPISQSSAGLVRSSSAQSSIGRPIAGNRKREVDCRLMDRVTSAILLVRRRAPDLVDRQAA
jgi:hypothetical protein